MIGESLKLKPDLVIPTKIKFQNFCAEISENTKQSSFLVEVDNNAEDVQMSLTVVAPEPRSSMLNRRLLPITTLNNQVGQR